MNRTTSVYLDAVRFTAALVVFLGHVSPLAISGGLLWQLYEFGTPAVDVFFVLSGFVIAHAADRRGMTGIDYGLDRASRILSVSIPALVITLALARFRPPWAPGVDADSLPILAQFLAGLLFLNESWFGHIQIGLNQPYWSLGYEVWYYIAFGVLTLAPARLRWPGALAALLIAGPRVAALFPLWLLGVAAYRACRREWVGARSGLLLFAMPAGAGLACVAWAVLHGGLPPANPIYARSGPELGVDYLVGAGFALSILGIHAAAPLLDGLCGRLAKPAAMAASVTFTLYAVHEPVLVAFRGISPWPASSLANRILVIGGTALTVVVVARFTERRRKTLRGLLAAAFGPRTTKNASGHLS